ncbi:hypothetical protein [Methylocystis echinoides]|uniref:hypothetical protein n=1 Tax=Methylocystis echinoides TaxID=29468 RepID=UPI00342205A4
MNRPNERVEFVHDFFAGIETRAAAEWVGKDGRARKLRDAEVTAARHKVGAVVYVHRQGCMLYELIPNMPEVRLRPLVEKFGLYINQHPSLNQTFSCV